MFLHADESAGAARPEVDRPAPAPAAGLSERRAWVVLAAILSLGLGLRAWGFGFGLPYDYHVAEPGYLAPAQLFDWQLLGQLFFFSSYSVLVLLAQRLLSLAAPLLGSLPAWFDLSDPHSAPVFMAVGRLVSAALGAATAIPVYLLGKRLWSRRVGLIAAFLLAVLYLHVRQSHYGTPDAAAAFFTAWAAYACTRLRPDGRVRTYLLAGALGGLAVSAKLLAWPVAALIVLFHLAPEAPGPRVHPLRRLFAPRLILAAVAMVATFLACTPPLLIDRARYLANWQIVASLGSLGGVGRMKITDAPAWLFYLQSLRWGMGDLMLAAALAGLVVAFARLRRAPRVACLMTFPLLAFALLLKPHAVTMPRYAMVALPFLVLAAASFLELLAARLPGKPRAAAAVALPLALAVQPALASVRHDVILTRENTRTEAKLWIEENLPEGAVIVAEPSGPPLATAEQPQPLATRQYQVVMAGPYGLPDRAGPVGEAVPLELDDYYADGVEILIVTSLIYDLPLIDSAEEIIRREAFYQRLDEEAELLAHFTPYAGDDKPAYQFENFYGPARELDKLGQPGPEIKVYRLLYAEEGEGEEAAEAAAGEAETGG